MAMRSMNSCLRFLTALNARCTGIILSTTDEPKKLPRLLRHVCRAKGYPRFPLSPLM